MAVSLNSISGFDSLIHKHLLIPRSSARVSAIKPSLFSSHAYSDSPRTSLFNIRRLIISGSATDDNTISAADSPSSDSTDQIPNDVVTHNESPSKAVDLRNVSASSNKRMPLTARERLRAARVLSRYAETSAKPTKPETGNKLLDVLKESDKKANKKPGLPQAPTNLFDDSKRGMPKPGLTFQFPGGVDILILTFSFVFISTVMFATTYLVWKLGAIHFNEY